jgi:hypothetical protein
MYLLNLVAFDTLLALLEWEGSSSIQTIVVETSRTDERPPLIPVRTGHLEVPLVDIAVLPPASGSSYIRPGYKHFIYSFICC